MTSCNTWFLHRVVGHGKVGLISYNAASLRVDVAEVSDLKIHMHDNLAVVTGAYHEKGVLAGKTYDYHDCLTDVWMKISGNGSSSPPTTVCPPTRIEFHAIPTSSPRSTLPVHYLW